MKIVLVRPNYKSHIITPPLGLGYLASFLKSHGIEPKILDGLKDNARPDELASRIVGEQADAVGITCLTAFYNEAIDLSCVSAGRTAGHHPRACTDVPPD
jgi:hypothetical protein